MAPVKPLILYIVRKPYFLEAPPIVANFPPPWLPSPRRRAPLQYQVDLRKKKVKWPPPPHRPPSLLATAGLPLLQAAGAAASLAAGAVAATSPPWGGTSPSSSSALLHHLYCNLLANMMCVTIYYFPMIYYIYV
jgi:hypothetical protein